MIKCVAIDDEPIALSIIQQYCAQYGDITLRSFTSPIEGMACIAEMRPDVVFLDIEMNSHNGLTLARSLPKGTCLILTTAYSQYAMEGFNVDAVDFLHKPIFYNRFERAMDKARRFINGAVDPSTLHIGSITLKSEHKNVVIGYNEIILIEAMDNYVKVYRKDRPMIMSQITMKEMVSMLPCEKFLRVHRSFIVALDAIEAFSNRKIVLRGYPHNIPVGRKYLGAFSDVWGL